MGGDPLNKIIIINKKRNCMKISLIKLDAPIGLKYLQLGYKKILLFTYQNDAFRIN